MTSFRIRYTCKHGEIGVTVNEVDYTYLIDAGFIPAIEKLAKYHPGKALNDLKRLAYHYMKEGGEQ